MSNIIKGSALLRSNPKVIELSGIGLLDAPKPVISEGEKARQESPEQFATIQMESQKVLQETEAMIVDLLDKARDEARAIMEAARDEAEIVHIQASQAAQEMKQQALEDGYREGLEKARQEMAVLQSEAQERSLALLEETRIQKLKAIKACEADILRLSMAIAKKVVAAELNGNPDVILNVIREATALLDSPDNISVQVNPAEVNHVLEGIGSSYYTSQDGEVIKYKVLPDNRIISGGCIIQSEAGMIDARMETRLENMEQLIQEVSGDD